MKFPAVILATVAIILLGVSCSHENTGYQQNTTTATTMTTSGK